MTNILEIGAIRYGTVSVIDQLKKTQILELLRTRKKN
jgi:hypothetical protein